MQLDASALTFQPRTPSGPKNKKEFWGDALETKQDGYIRIASRNIGGLGICAGNSKEEHLKQWIVNSEIDCIGIQEHNINIKQYRDKERISERMKSAAWEFFRISTGYNKHHERDNKHLFGGTIVLTQGQFCHRVATTGADERGLGRWAWMHVKGINKASARIILAYRPCKTNSDLHNSTVYRQHYKRLKETDIDECPIQQFQFDLIQLIQKWMKNGDKIILMVDSNEDIRDGTFDTALRRIGLISGIRNRHGNNPPPTQHRESVPIDDIGR